jgi:hypothetical protein
MWYQNPEDCWMKWNLKCSKQQFHAKF